MIFGKLAREATLFVKFRAGKEKSISNFWPPMLEQPIKFVLSVDQSYIHYSTHL